MTHSSDTPHKTNCYSCHQTNCSLEIMFELVANLHFKTLQPKCYKILTNTPGVNTAPEALACFRICCTTQSIDTWLSSSGIRYYTLVTWTINNDVST